MKLTAQTLLNELPPFKDDWIKIKDRQVVADIVERIQVAHKKYAHYYDKLALYFDADTIDQICDNISGFLKSNIEYTEEPEKIQTTSLPTGILVRGFGDCKHYASFTGGILDALTRLTDKKINWCYRFVSYDLLNKKPGHVFVVVKEPGEEIWIDPVPGAETAKPIWQTDVYIKGNNMAMYENIAGVTSAAKIGATINVVPFKEDQLNFYGDHRYAQIWDPYLGLSAYQDFGGEKIIGNINDLVAQLNQLIALGVSPGHTVDANFVQWIYDNSVRSWNFYYPGGVRPGFDGSSILPANYPRPVFTSDNRIVFSPDVPLDDGGNAEIHILNAWLQDLVNNYAAEPWPVKPREIKEFSQHRKGDNFLMQTRRTADNWLSDIGKAINDAFNVVKEGFLKITGSVFRNSYLAAIGLNAFKWATHLQANISAGKWDEMAKTWRSIGGDPSKLLNTIEHGSKQPAVDENGESIGVVQVAAMIAAATPIIAIMLKYMDKSGKAGEIVNAAIPLLEQNFPDIDFTPLARGLNPIVRSTGARVEYYVDPVDDENKGGGNNDLPGQTDVLSMVKKNPEIAAAGGTLVSYFLLNKKRNGKKNILVPIGIGAGIYFLLRSMGKQQTVAPVTDPAMSKRTALVNWIQSTRGDQTGEDIDYFKKIFASEMTDSEIDSVYDYIFNYFKQNIPVPDNSQLFSAIMQISDKYQIFT